MARTYHGFRDQRLTSCRPSTETKIEILKLRHYAGFSDVINQREKRETVMAVIKRLNVNTFTSEADNDAFIAELTEMWQNWSGPKNPAKISVEINKDRDNPMRMTAFVTIDGEEAFLASN